MTRLHIQDEVTKSLTKNGAELFAQKGFKNTTVAEITEKVGIATGTFYNYFSSKEELFLVVFVEENNALKRRILAEVDPESDPVEVVKQLVYRFFAGMQESPVLRELFNQDTFRKVEKKTNFGKEAYGEVAYELFVPIIEKWQREGVVKKKDPKYVVAFFDALLYVFLHREDIGSRFFPELMDDLITYIVEGLRVP